MDTYEFKNIFLPLNGKLFSIALRLLGNRDEAEDMVQDTYLRLWNKRNSINEISNFEAFAVTVLKNICLDAIRARHFVPSQLDSFQDNIPCENSTEEDVESKDELITLFSIMDTLPSQQKLVLTLRHVNDYSIEEIEYATGLSNINIRTLLSRARKKLREKFYH